MSLMHKVRFYHAVLAVVVLLAYLTGDFGAIHDWLGYGVGVIVVFRLLWAVFNPRQLGLNRFYTVFDGISWANGLTHPAISKALILAVAVTTILATVTGLLILDDHSAWEDLHEGVSSLVIWAVAAHAIYLFLVKRPLANFMLYRSDPTRRRSGKTGG